MKTSEMTDKELMQQALEALNRSDYLGWQLNIPIIKALRDRLAQPVQGVQANPTEVACAMNFEQVAEFSYKMADAMLAARGEK